MSAVLQRVRRLERAAAMARATYDPEVIRDREAVAEGGFMAFVKLAWPHIDAAIFKGGWHIEELCDALDDAAHRRHRGEAVDLAVAMPPGASKSRPTSVLWQAWVWTWWPGSSWITTSWDDDLAYKFSALSLDLVRTSWYQARWPMKIVGGISRFSNSFGGSRVVGGVHSRFTGDHAHFIVGDDLLKEQLARRGSPSAIADAVGVAGSFWFGTLGTRAIDHIGCRVLVAQLLHRDDPVTVAIRDRGYERIVFPVTYELDHPYPCERDRRTVAGELLHDRIDQKRIDDIILDIGPTAAAAQLWQRPEPPGGQLLRAEYMQRRWKVLPPDLRATMGGAPIGPGQYWLIAGDLASKGKRQSRRRGGPDHTVLQLWCMHGQDLYLVDQDRGQWGYREAKARLGAFSLRYPWVAEILLEDAANAPALEDDLLEDGFSDADLEGSLGGAPRQKGWCPSVTLEPHGGGCLARVQAVEGMWHAGRVLLPLGPRWVDEVHGFIDEHLRYSGVEGESDDQVATSGLAMLHFKTTGGASWARH